jgi:hypothetical protein
MSARDAVEAGEGPAVRVHGIFPIRNEEFLHVRGEFLAKNTNGGHLTMAAIFACDAPAISPN